MARGVMKMRSSFAFSSIVLGSLIFTGCDNIDFSMSSPSSTTPSSYKPALMNAKYLSKAIAAQKAHDRELLSIHKVIATGTGLNDSGSPVVVVLVEQSGVPGIPA